MLIARYFEQQYALLSQLQPLAPSDEWLATEPPTEPSTASRVWLKCVYLAGHNEDAFLQRVEGALDLLALVARVDPVLCKKVVLIIWPDARTKWFSGLSGRPVEIGIHAKLKSSEDLTTLKQWVIRAYAHDTFYALRCDEVEKISASLTQSSSVISCCVPLRLEMRGPEHNNALSQVLLQLLQLVMAQQHNARDSDRGEERNAAAVRLPIVGIGFDPTIEHGINEQGIQYLHQLMEHGVFVRDIPALEASKTRPAEGIDFITPLRGLMGISHEAAPSGVQSITISHRTPEAFLMPLMSALQVSPSVRTVRVETSSRSAWRHIAYALFSRHAGHNIARVELDLTNLTQEDVDAMAEILASSDPLQSLLGKQASGPGSFVSSDHFFLKRPRARCVVLQSQASTPAGCAGDRHADQ